MFQDAVDATIRLASRYQVRYLWIDAICIIRKQESNEDWKRESKIRGLVYKNSFCTLAAATGMDGTSGLLSHTDPIHIQRHVVTPLWAAEEKKFYVAEEADQWNSEITNSPLFRRCWVT